MLPRAHIYCFSASASPQEAVRSECEEHLGSRLDDDHFLGVHFVRNVSTNKSMYRIDFIVPKTVLFSASSNGVATDKNIIKRPVSPSSEDLSSNKR